MRWHEGRALVVIAVRLFAILDGAGHRTAGASRLPLAAPIWGDTQVLLPPDLEGATFVDQVTGVRHAPARGGPLAVAGTLRAFPGAVLLFEPKNAP